MEMSPARLMLRCYAENKGDHWEAFCLDLTLATQADTLEEARDSLHEMIEDYVYDAVAGQDREFAGQLLLRRAPLRYWTKWCFYVILFKLGRVGTGIRQLFREPLPLILAPRS